MNRLHKILPYAALLLFVLQLLLMLGSWIFSATMPGSEVRSLLTGEGLRWFLGGFSRLLSTPLLVWLLLLAMSYGVLRGSRLLHRVTTYRENWARWMTLLLGVVYVGFILLLTVTPHAVLLSATGCLWPSPFSDAFVPLVAFGMMVLSAFYGIASGHLPTFRDVFNALSDGIRSAATFVVFYVLIIQFYESLRYVLG